MKITEGCVIAALGIKSRQNGSAHEVGASYSGLYEEGEVEHMNCGIGIRNWRPIPQLICETEP